ncbi:MAG TPA: peptide deformylase [Candidatus Magasanikbacteria bacterium]|nr:peptide deformylase [Candidatus Magasanikbacteria bacterium]
MLTIITVPDKILETPARELTLAEINTPKIQELISAMIPKMYESEGIGLAAPQVNHSVRVCIIGKEAIKMDRKTTVPYDDLVLINPTWVKTSKKTNNDQEGCLSIPGVYGTVKRYSAIHVEALDRHGNKLSFEARNFFARVIQHEVDHLDGVLFTTKAVDLKEIKK